MELAVFTSIVGVIKEIVGISDVFSKAEERKRERIAAWLQELGELIQDVADKIELNDYPHNTCAQMEIMVEHFPLIVEDILPKEKIEELTENLKSVCCVEQLFGELNNIDKEEKDNSIILLLHASGRLQGLASIIKHLD